MPPRFQIQKPKRNIIIRIPLSAPEQRVEAALQRLANSCTVDELEQLAASAENPAIKQMALSALQSFSS